MPFTKFPSLESFAHVWRSQSRFTGGDVIQYRAKIKLHGTNAGIRIEDGEVVGQKRTSDVFVGQDNAGFAAWLEPHKERWAVDRLAPTVFFGEWAGPGVKRGDAVSQIDRKVFFIFAAQVGNRIITEPQDIEALLPEDGPHLDDVVVLPWSPDIITIDFTNPAQADSAASIMTELSEKIGESDPFIKDVFDIDGPGEGLVWVPYIEGVTIHRDIYSALTFKTKSARHGVKKAPAATRTLVVPEGVHEFVDMFVTTQRCHQALTESCEGLAEKSRTGDFLKWIGNDVKKEGHAELSEAGLEWKQVAKFVNSAAVRWFHERCDKPFGEIA